MDIMSLIFVKTQGPHSFSLKIEKISMSLLQLKYTHKENKIE